MDGIWHCYNLKGTGRIYMFPQIETFEQETVSRVIFFCKMELLPISVVLWLTF